MDTTNTNNEHLTRVMFQNQVVVASSTVKPAINITTNGTTPVNTTTGESGWLGLTSTQLLVVFLIIVFAILILFLLIYYFVIKGMRQRSIGKLAQKSISGSIGEGRDRNIFANPERQMAVDQSTRASSHSPTSMSDNEQITTTQAPQPSSNPSNIPPPVAPVSLSSQQQQQLTPSTSTASISPAGAKLQTGQSATRQIPPSINLTKSSGFPTSGSQRPMNVQAAQNAANPKGASQPPPPTPTTDLSQGKKSNSESKKRKQKAADADSHDPQTILGALAGLRDTLKDSDSHK